jgi:N-methylhydantoinase A
MRFATDTGGTFTDLVVEDDDGRITMYKSPTVPSDPVQGVIGALQLAADERNVSLRELLGRANMFIHGTTHAINAIITGRTARTALLVTQGHRDMLVFREGGRLEPFNHAVPFPQPFVPRSLTFEIPERIIYNGDVLEKINEPEVLKIIEQLKVEAVEAVAVCLLWSTINHNHERRIGELLKQHLPDVPVTLSHEVNPTLREFRRASSAAIDASLKPLMGKYLGGLTERLADAGFHGEVMVLTSGGGMMASADVAAAPVKVINSGPSMAPVSGQYYAALEDEPDNVIVADTGGTTYDISLVRGGIVPMTRELWIGQPLRGHLVGYPSVEVKSVGAGGGSIAHVYAGGVLAVGPQSAGATPGPVCYGRGGTLPTVTDASVVLGYLDPEFFLGGAIKLDRNAAFAAIEEHVAKLLDLPVEEAAWRIIELATENMVQAIADVTVAQGIDPTNAVLIGGGGAAGLNSTFIARRLGCKALIIPETGAALSAAGAMMGDLTAEFAGSLFTTLASFDRPKVETSIADLTARCQAFNAKAMATGAREGIISFVAEARYAGQVWDIDVPFLPENLLSDNGLAAFRRSFDTLHQQIFAVSDAVSDVEVIGIRATIRCGIRDHEDFRLEVSVELPKTAGLRPIYFYGHGHVDTVILRLEHVVQGTVKQGPAIIESAFTTIVIDPDARFSRSDAGSIVIQP